MQESANFEYLRGVAQKYGLLYGVHEFDAAADNMTSEQLQELRDVYAIICSGDNRAQIQRWTGECFDRRGKISKREFDFAMQVGQTFVLFDYLVRRGIQPFCDKEMEHAPPAMRPNWVNFPKELSYLIEPAKAYGIHDDVEVCRFLDNAHRKDMELLAKTAECMRLNGHWKILNKWMDDFPIDKHQEAWMAYRLIGVMDLAGFKFESSE